VILSIFAPVENKFEWQYGNDLMDRMFESYSLELSTSTTPGEFDGSNFEVLIG